MPIEAGSQLLNTVWLVSPGRVKLDEQSSVVPGPMIPAFQPDAAVNGLNVDPAG